MIIIKHFNHFVFLFKLVNLTDFSFVTTEVRDICTNVANQINESTNVDDTKLYVNQIKNNIIEIVKEKDIIVEYCILETKNKDMFFNVYKHKYIHGNDYTNTCEKVCIFVSDKKLDKDKILEVAIEVIGFNYSNIFVEQNVVNRFSSFDPNRLDINCVHSIESYFSILQLLKFQDSSNSVKMIYVL